MLSELNILVGDATLPARRSPEVLESGLPATILRAALHRMPQRYGGVASAVVGFGEGIVK